MLLAGGPGGSLAELLRREERLLSAELRPPRADAPGPQSMDDWIDTYHAIRRLTRAGTRVFITDNAVGSPEEENLRHLVNNLGPDANRSRIIPFLTSKHPLDYCLRYAERAFEQGFGTLVVLGGDRHDGIPRCVGHAFELRSRIRKMVPGLSLGGWANPHSDPAEQSRYMRAKEYTADFFLTQVVSHHSWREVERFCAELRRVGIGIPGIFGVFYYRSARRKSLDRLGRFFPVPVMELQREFEEENLHPDEVCARSIRRLWELGIGNIYISNLPLSDVSTRLKRIRSLCLESPQGR